MTLTQVSTDGVKNDAISHNKIPANAVQASELADNAVDTAAIADDAVTDAKLANSINSAIAANTAKTSNATHTGDVTGSTSLTIADDAVTTAKIADDAVTQAKIATGAITTTELSGDIPANKLEVNDAHIIIGDASADGTLQTLSGDVTMTRTGAVTIANDAVNADKIADNAIDANRLSDDAVTTNKIQDNAVSTVKINGGAVTTAKIADNAVDMNKLSDLDNGRIIARVSSGSGSPEAATAAQIRTLLNVEDGSTAGGGLIKKVASRRYYGFEQTTGIGNAGFTKMTKAFVTITPTSASNSIRLSGTMNWSGSDTENQYSFRWRREITGGTDTSLDGDLGSGSRPGIQFRLLGNGDVATMLLGPVIDQPNTTSAITYYIEAFVDGANQSVYLNRGQNDSNDPRYERAASYFIAEELDNSAHTHTNTNS